MPRVGAQPRRTPCPYRVPIEHALSPRHNNHIRWRVILSEPNYAPYLTPLIDNQPSLLAMRDIFAHTNRLLSVCRGLKTSHVSMETVAMSAYRLDDIRMSVQSAVLTALEDLEFEPTIGDLGNPTPPSYQTVFQNHAAAVEPIPTRPNTPFIPDSPV
jgi:hypothetical protein